MTETTLAVAEQPAPEPDPSPWLWLRQPSLAEVILAGHPGARDAFRGSDDTLAELVAMGLGRLPVYISGEEREAWREQDRALDAWEDNCRAEAVIGQTAGLKRATENLWPLSARYAPPRLVPGDDTLQHHQMASVTDLGRWAPGKSLEDDPETDRAATRFMAAFDADPEGDADRAPLPPEIHHESGEIR